MLCCLNWQSGRQLIELHHTFVFIHNITMGRMPTDYDKLYIEVRQVNM